MHKMMLKIKRIVSTIYAWSLALRPFVWGTLTLQRPLKNHRLRRATACAGLDEYFPLNINGHRQWLRIRGRSSSNPVLLYLHGGPGGSQIPSFRHYQLGWETEFTVVHWEQRGAGKSYSSTLDPTTVTLSQLVADALAVIDYLRKRFARDDIILLGHSWGTLLAIHVLRTRTEGISAYIGVGQVAHQVRSEQRMYDYALSQAHSKQNGDAVSQLSQLHGYPEVNNAPHKVALVRYWARTFGYMGSHEGDDGRNHTRLMSTPEYGLFDVYRFLRGSLVCAARVGNAMLTDLDIQPLNLDKDFDVPMYFFSGRRDHFTPVDLADQYCLEISAPIKKHVVFEHSGHYPQEDQPAEFLTAMMKHVKPHTDSSKRLVTSSVRK